MQVHNPQELLDSIDKDLLSQYLAYEPLRKRTKGPRKTASVANKPVFSEPYGLDSDPLMDAGVATTEVPKASDQKTTDTDTSSGSEDHMPASKIQGKVLRLGDFIDTDAVCDLFP